MASDDNDDGDLKRLTVRELRERAVKSLGAKAAGLKTKGELVAALSVDWGAAVERKPAVVPQPKVVASSPLSVSAATRTEPAAELPIARDFFVDPKRPALPTAYGDDRLLCFRREPLAMVISWDLSSTTWGDGHGVSLELIEPKGRLVARADVLTATGLKTFEQLPEGKPLVPQLVRKGRVMTRGRAFTLGALIEDGLRYQMTVAWGGGLPTQPPVGATATDSNKQPYTGPVTLAPGELVAGISASSPLPFSPARV